MPVDANIELILGTAQLVTSYGVTRDREIIKIHEEIGEDFGSGYPSDPKTVEFLKKNVYNPKVQEYIRKGWQSYKRLVEENKQKKLGDY